MTRSVQRGRTWMKLSADYRTESPDIADACAREWVKQFGAQRLMRSSD